MHTMPHSPKNILSLRFPDDWRSKSGWLETAHHAARLLRRDVANASPQQVRLAIEMASRLNPGPWGGEFHEVREENLRGAVVTWKEHDEGTIVWMHGGAFAFGSPRVYRAVATHLARATRCKVVLPSYRLAPEHVHPTAHDDAQRALEVWLHREPSLVLVGDSAGGNLAASAVASVIENNPQLAAKLRGLALLSPWCDLRPEALSLAQNRIDHSPFDGEDSWAYSQTYLAGQPSDDASVSPILMNFSSLWPETYLEWALDEFLAPDIERWAERMESQHVALTTRTEPMAVHGWQMLPDVLPEAVRSVKALGAWIRTRFELASTPR